MRLFIATTFPEAVLKDLNDRVAKFRTRLPPASWVRAESQHLTLAFLGEQPESIVGKLEEPLARATASVPRFPAVLRGCGLFPNARHPRVGWVGIDAEAPLVSLAAAVRGAVKGAGCQFEESDFKPHLTLLRIRDPWPPASVELFHKSLRDYASPALAVDAVTLFSSRLDPKGAIHTPLRTFALGA